jgi:hypothetical protein
MATSLQLYEARIHEIITAIKEMFYTQVTIDWKIFLDAHTEEEHVTGVSGMLTDAAKTMLGEDGPPTVARIQSLPAVADYNFAGTYSGLTRPVSLSLVH